MAKKKTALVSIVFTTPELIEYCQKEINALIRKMGEHSRAQELDEADDGW